MTAAADRLTALAIAVDVDGALDDHVEITVFGPDLLEYEPKGPAVGYLPGITDADARWAAWLAVNTLSRLALAAEAALSEQRAEHRCGANEYERCGLSARTDLGLHRGSAELVACRNVTLVAPRRDKRTWLDWTTHAIARLAAEDREWGQVDWAAHRPHGRTAAPLALVRTARRGSVARPGRSAVSSASADPSLPAAETQGAHSAATPGAG